MVKYNVLLIFCQILNCLVFYKTKINYCQLSSKIVIVLVSLNTKEIVLVQWHTAVMMFEFFRHLDFVSMLVQSSIQLLWLKKNFHAIQLVTMIYNFEFHQKNLLGVYLFLDFDFRRLCNAKVDFANTEAISGFNISKYSESFNRYSKCTLNDTSLLM